MFAVDQFFDGEPVRWWQDDDGSLWITADELGRQLGYSEGKERQSVMTLAGRIGEELTPFRSVIEMMTEAGRRETTVFEEHGAYLLAMRARTEKAASFRLGVSKMLARFRRRDVIVVPRQTWDAQRQMTVEAFEQLERERAFSRRIASMAGAALSNWKHHRVVNPEQSAFPFLEARRIGGANHTAALEESE